MSRFKLFPGLLYFDRVGFRLNYAGLNQSGLSTGGLLFHILMPAELLDVSTMTLNNWNKTGKLKAHKIGGIVSYDLEDINNIS